MKYIYYYDSHQMNEETARKQIDPILEAGDVLAVIPRPGGFVEVVTLPEKD